jgi:sucrose-6-phosphate hydrolase SacC (GH32 family)
MEYKEKILLAEGSSPYSFEKKSGWEIVPPSDLGQKNDFRDPQAYYDAESDKIIMTVTASKGNVARILKYSMNKDLSDIKYEGIIFSDPTKKFWNLECSDTFKIGNYYYITYSAQDDTLWYAISDNAYGPYRNAKRLDSKLFYAAKHVESASNYYMVGWARRSESPSSTQEVSAWAGNLAVQKIVQKEDGQLLLAPVEAITKQFNTKEKLTGKKNMQIEAGSLYTYEDLALCPESFCLEGKFEYSGKGSFGLAFDYNGRQNKYKTISISPSENKLQLFFNEGNTLITETEINLTEGKKYSFTYIQDGSVGIFYIENQASLTVRLYGVTGNIIKLFAETNNVKFTDLKQYTK